MRNSRLLHQFCNFVAKVRKFPETTKRKRNFFSEKCIFNIIQTLYPQQSLPVPLRQSSSSGLPLRLKGTPIHHAVTHLPTYPVMTGIFSVLFLKKLTINIYYYIYYNIYNNKIILSIKYTNYPSYHHPKRPLLHLPTSKTFLS